MEAVVIAIVASFNLLIIKWKFGHKRYEDGILDVICLVILVGMFSDSGQGGMIIATISSFIISISLLIAPPKFLSSYDAKSFIDEFKKRLPQ